MSPSVAVTFALPEADIVIDLDSGAGVELAKLSPLVGKPVTGVMHKKQEADSKSKRNAWTRLGCSRCAGARRQKKDCHQGEQAGGAGRARSRSSF